MVGKSHERVALSIPEAGKLGHREAAILRIQAMLGEW
jgi:hypothetical protein